MLMNAMIVTFTIAQNMLNASTILEVMSAIARWDMMEMDQHAIVRLDYIYLQVLPVLCEILIIFLYLCIVSRKVTITIISLSTVLIFVILVNGIIAGCIKAYRRFIPSRCIEHIRRKM